MAHNPVRWFEIYVQDVDRAKKFYEDVFQLKLQPLHNPSDESLQMWQFPANEKEWGVSGALVRMKGVASGGNSTIIYFGCADCAIEEDRIAPAGGKVEKSKTAIGQYGFISLVYDTEGNMIGLHSME